MRTFKVIALIVIMMALLIATKKEGDMDEVKFDQMLYPTVRVELNSGGTGTGVVIYSGGGISIILTAKHVMQRALQAKIVTFPEESEYHAVLLRKSKDYDLALLVMDHEHPYVARFASDPKLKVYDTIWKVGCGNSLNPYPSKGLVSNFYEEVIQIDTNTTFGDSGGPIFKKVGDNYELVGIIQAVAMLDTATPIYHIGIAHDWHSIADFLVR